MATVYVFPEEMNSLTQQIKGYTQDSEPYTFPADYISAIDSLKDQSFTFEDLIEGKVEHVVYSGTSYPSLLNCVQNVVLLDDVIRYDESEGHSPYSNIGTTVTFPNVTSINTSNAFAQCTHIKCINLPNCTEITGQSPFYGCENLT